MMKSILLLLAAAVFLWNCGEDTIPEVTESPYNTYIAGSYLTNGAMKACYWINGERRELLTNTAAGETSYASGIVKVDDFLYLSGSIRKGSGVYKTYYWTVNLTNNAILQTGLSWNLQSADLEASSITVSGNIIYLVGYYYIDGLPYKYASFFRGTSGTANLARTSSLVPNTTDSFAYDVILYNSRAYVAGKYLSGSDSTAFYWIEGQGRRDLPSLGKSSAQGIYVFEYGLVEFKYIAGYFQSNESYRACYWLDNGISITRFNLHPAGAAHSYANDVFVSADGTVYITGSYDTGLRRVPCYWIDGVRTDISGMPGSSQKIAVLDGKVFSAGYYQPFLKDVACYWIDDQRFDIGNGTNSRANSIVVEKKAE